MIEPDARLSVVAVLGAVIALVACESPGEVPWEVRPSEPSVLGEAVVVETTVRRGGCEGVLVYRAPIGPGRRGPPPALGRGLHGFAAEARDAACRTIARGCVERDLPLARGARVDLVIERVAAAEACAPSACADGTCTDRDAGAIEDADAATPGDPDDAGSSPADGGLDPVDSGPPSGDDAGVVTPACDGTEWSGRCYVARGEARDWATAEAACVAWGGHLVSLGGPDEERFVRALASGPYWIGLHDLAEDRVFTWVDGSAASYRNWLGGAPSGNPMFHCATDDPAGAWQLRRCRESFASACER